MSKFIFGSNVTVDNSLTLEVDDSVLQTILNGEPLVLRGQSGSSAAICTDYSTHQLRQVVNSNTCFLVEASSAVIEQATLPTSVSYPQQILPLVLEPSHTIRSLVTCNYDFLPPTTTDDHYCFQQFVALFPQTKQFHFNHMKLLLTIYKQDRNLYYKLIHNGSIGEYKNDDQGLFHEFELKQSGSYSNTVTTTSTPNPTKSTSAFAKPSSFNDDPLDFLGGLDSIQDSSITMATDSTNSPVKRPKRALYQSKTSYERDAQTYKYDSSIAIKQTKTTSTLIVSTNDVTTTRADQSISVLFDWSAPTSFSSLYGYTFLQLQQLIQTSKYQLLHFLPQYPILYLEGQYNLLSYELIHHVLNPILDLCGFLRTKFNTPVVNPSHFAKSNTITGLNTTTPSLIFSRNFLLHELEIDGICCPLVALTVLLYFIDWDITAAMYTPYERVELPPDASPLDIEIETAKSTHQYHKYQRFFQKHIKPSKTPTIPNTLPHMYQDFDSYNYHINDLFGFNDDQYTNSRSIFELNNTHPQPNDNSALVSVIPPIFAISMSKVVRFYTQHITTAHHYQQHSTYDDMSTKQIVPPCIPMELILKQLREKLLEPLLPNFFSILVDLAGLVMIDDPVYTPQKGYHPMYNKKSKVSPKLPLTFNLEEYSQRSTLYFICNPIHNPSYLYNIKFNLLNSAKERFDFIFKIRKQWTITAIKPFLLPIVKYSNVNVDKVRNYTGVHIFPFSELLSHVHITSIDQLLLKHARAVTSTVKDAANEVVQTNVTYCAR